MRNVREFRKVIIGLGVFWLLLIGVSYLARGQEAPYATGLPAYRNIICSPDCATGKPDWDAMRLGIVGQTIMGEACVLLDDQKPPAGNGVLWGTVPRLAPAGGGLQPVTLCRLDPPPPPPAVPSELQGIRIGGWVPDWCGVEDQIVRKVRTYPDPDLQYIGCKDSLTENYWVVSFKYANIAKWFAGLLTLDPTTPKTPATPCDIAFVWEKDPAVRRKTCAVTWDITMQVRARVYADDKFTKVGDLPKNTSCASFAYVGPVAGTPKQDWYRTTATNGVSGLVKCQATDY